MIFFTIKYFKIMNETLICTYITLLLVEPLFTQKYLIYMKAIQGLQEALLPLPAPSTPLLTPTSYIWNFIPGLPTCSSNTWSIFLSQLHRSPSSVCEQWNTASGKGEVGAWVQLQVHTTLVNTIPGWVIPYLLPFIYFKNAISSWSFGNLHHFPP